MATDPRILDDRVSDLEQRLDRMEQVLRDVVEAMRRRAMEVPSAHPTSSARSVPTSGTPHVPQSRAPRNASAPPVPQPVSSAVARALEGKGSAWWLSRAGIGLLLFGVAFLFKYAIDQGWLTPWIRVGFGLAVGAVLVIIGLRVWQKRRWFGAVALGGASATFYITGFAAFQLLHVATYATALGFMIAVTLYTTWAAWHTDDAILGVLGAVGGLGTPFLLYTAAGSVAGLAAYESVVLVGIAGIYYKKGWDALLRTSVVGGWCVVLMGLDDLSPSGPHGADQWGLQVAVLIASATLWAVPVWRARAVPRARKDYVPEALGLITPLIGFYVSTGIWHWERAWGAAVAGVAALLWAGAWWRLRRDASGDDALASMHAVAAAALLAVALQHLFTSHGLLLALAVELVGLHYVARATGDRFLRLAGHGLALVVAVWFAGRLTGRLTGDDAAALAVVNWRAAAHAAALLLGLAAARTLADRQESALYQLGVHVLFLAWLYQELSRLPTGQAWVSVAWGVYATALLVVGLRLDASTVRAAALATLALVVAKLFLVDLSKLEAIWRVLLFMGFGAGFLALSYYFPSLWKAKPGAPQAGSGTRTGER